MTPELPVSVESPSSCTHAAFEALTGAVLAHDERVAGHLNALIGLDPEHVRGWAVKAVFLMTLARSELIPAARDAAARARACLGHDPDERDYVLAAESLVAGDWHGAIALFDHLLERNPRDSMAAKLSHALRFMLGDAEGMLRSIEQVITRSGPDHRHAGFLLGCKAFALEECHRFEEAERTGRAAIEREPSDAWGMHAVSHVFEMTGRAADGLDWIERHPRAVWGCNNFRYHLLWHQALFRLDLGDTAGAVDLYDHFIRADRTDDFRDIANGASLLKRLELAGVDVQHRWEEMAVLCATRIEDRSLVFADLHYVMALAGAGRKGAARALAESLSGVPARSAQQGALAQSIGAGAAQAIIDHANGNYAAAADALLGLRPRMQAIGGSHAQRDIFEQVLLDSLVRCGHPQAKVLLRARLIGRGGNNGFAEALLRRQAGHPAARDVGWNASPAGLVAVA